MIVANAFDWSILVTTPFLPWFLAGVVFLIIGIVGGGISYKSLFIPKIATFPRALSGVVGTLALTFGLYLVLHQTQQGGIESLDCAKNHKVDGLR